MDQKLGAQDLRMVDSLALLRSTGGDDLDVVPVDLGGDALVDYRVPPFSWLGSGQYLDDP